MQHKFIFMLKHTLSNKNKDKIICLRSNLCFNRNIYFFFIFNDTQVHFHAFHTITLSVFYLSVWFVLCTIKYIRVDLMYSDPLNPFILV